MDSDINFKLERILVRNEVYANPDVPVIVQALRRAFVTLEAIPPPNPYWAEVDKCMADIAAILGRATP